MRDSETSYIVEFGLCESDKSRTSSTEKDSKAEADRAIENLIASKIGKGYEEVK